MGKLHYNRLSNNRLKNIVLGTFTIVLFWFLMVYLNTPEGKGTSVFQSVIFLFVLIGFSCLLRLIPFEQVIETTTDRNVEMFYKLGAFRFNKRSLGRTVSITLDQDQKRYYCLILEMPDGKKLTMERYPTLGDANERLDEFKRILD